MIQQIWLVCGGRKFGHLTSDLKLCDPQLYAVRKQQRIFIHRTLDKLSCERSTLFNPDDNWLPSDITIIAGGAEGADSAAIEWAVVNWLSFKEFPVTDKDWKWFGKYAGHRRNQQMLTAGKPTLCIAFPGNRGTADMISRARNAKVEVIEVQYTPA